MFPNFNFVLIFTSAKQPPTLSSHLCASRGCLLNTGLTVHALVIVFSRQTSGRNSGPFSGKKVYVIPNTDRKNPNAELKKVCQHFKRNGQLKSCFLKGHVLSGDSGCSNCLHFFALKLYL